MKLKIISCLLWLASLPLFSHAQSGTWTWMKGDSFPNGTGNFGIRGVPSALNEPPPRYLPAQWVDSAGFFWVFAGYDELHQKVMTDLWKFDPTTVIWTWMGGQLSTADSVPIYGPQGVFTDSCWPGPVMYNAPTWVDKNNHLWLYGGANKRDALSNLWQYDPSRNQWAWMGGGQNVLDGVPVYGTEFAGTTATNPGSRTFSQACWTDSADLWLFGGCRERSGYLDSFYNDVWRYNIPTGIWTWMSGSNVPASAGSYGTLGIPSVNNYPSSREVDMHWQDKEGNFYLSGGFNFSNFYDDVWKFNPITLEWTWLSGSQSAAGPPVTTPYCSASANYTDGGRAENCATFKLNDSLVMTYGGFTTDFGGNLVNDIWAYLPAQNEWMKMTDGPAAGSYGSLGVPSTSNYPPVRFGGAGFMDRQNNPWIFGGRIIQLGSVGGFYSYNDVWKYTIDTNCTRAITGTVTQAPALNIEAGALSGVCGGCNGVASASGVYGTPPYHYSWSPGNDTGVLVQNLCAGLYRVTVTDSLGATATDSVFISTGGAPQVTISSADSTICTGDSARICATTGFETYSWNSGDTSTCIYARNAGNYYVTVTNGSGCVAQSNHISISTYTPSSISISVSGDTLTVYNGTVYEWLLDGQPLQGDTGNVLIAPQSGTYAVTIKDANGCYATSNQVGVTEAGIRDLLLNDEISIYPNPLQSGAWHLAVSDRLIGSRAELFDPEGQLIYHFRITAVVTQIQPAIAGGVYLMRIITDNGNVMRKLVKL